MGWPSVLALAWGVKLLPLWWPACMSAVLVLEVALSPVVDIAVERERARHDHRDGSGGAFDGAYEAVKWLFRVTAFLVPGSAVPVWLALCALPLALDDGPKWCRAAAYATCNGAMDAAVFARLKTGVFADGIDAQVLRYGVPARLAVAAVLLDAREHVREAIAPHVRHEPARQQRAVIDQLHLHHGTKLTGPYRPLEVFLEIFHEAFIQWDGGLWAGSMYEAGAGAFFVLRVEGELADH